MWPGDETSHSAAIAAELYHCHLHNHSASVVYSSPTSHGSKSPAYGSRRHGKRMRSTQLYTLLQDHQAVEKLAGRTIHIHASLLYDCMVLPTPLGAGLHSQDQQ